LQVDGTDLDVDPQNVLIAVGGKPLLPQGVEGIEYCISSDEFFEMQYLPKKVAVVGAGYIAVELAGVLNGLGSETSLFCRKGGVLRNFDVSVHAFTPPVYCIVLAQNDSTFLITPCRKLFVQHCMKLWQETVFIFNRIVM